MRVESRPSSYARESPLEYLTRGAPTKRRKVRRHYFTVGRSGQLLVAQDTGEE